MRYLIRDVIDYDELQQCVAIQERTWGPAFGEIVPAAILWVAARTGGVVAAAYDGAGAMVGFVFGVSGYRDGRPLHWSDMLAVLPEARGSGVGLALKRHQREVLLENGIEDVYWTFDPLESRNAHLNFARLGAVATEYIRDCYGATSSPLHAGLPTDRLVAHWRLASDRVRWRMGDGGDALGAARPDGVTAGGGAHRNRAAEEVQSLPLINDGFEVRLNLDSPLTRLRIPADIQRLKADAPAEALRWREATRAGLEAYLRRGYAVVDLVRENADFSCYLLGSAAEL